MDENLLSLYQELNKNKTHYGFGMNIMPTEDEIKINLFKTSDETTLRALCSVFGFTMEEIEQIFEPAQKAMSYCVKEFSKELKNKMETKANEN